MKKNIQIVFIITMIALGILFYNSINTSNNDNPEDYPIWVEMMEQPGVKIEDARKAFDVYWKQNTHHKGDKSKKFEHWYAINSKRLDKYGKVISAAQVNSEYQKLRLNAATHIMFLVLKEVCLQLQMPVLIGLHLQIILLVKFIYLEYYHQIQPLFL